jgi:hypothetical protein
MLSLFIGSTMKPSGGITPWCGYVSVKGFIIKEK